MNVEKFLKYYQNELDFLVESGKDFSKQYPKIASKLDFSSFNSDDPQVQRLIESVAFLNARIQKRLDESAPEVSLRLLESIYPQFISPLPSCVIFNFSPLKNFEKAVIGKTIPKGSYVNTKKEYEGDYFSFQTNEDLKISSLEVESALIEKTSSFNLPNYIYNSCEYALNIKLNLLDENSSESELRFFIHLIDHLAGTFYESIHSVFHNKNTPVFCNGKEVGEIISVAIDDEELLPYFYRANDPTYRVFLEYNAFYKKFLFFKIRFFEGETYDYTDLVIPLNLKKEIEITKENLLLNCVCGVNLFEKTSEPFELSNKKNAYRLIPDMQNENTEIHTILSVHETQESETNYIPYFSCQHLLIEDDCVFWSAKKDSSKFSNPTILSFSNMDNFENKVIFAKMMCFQKNASKSIPSFAEWSVQDSPGDLNCINLERPSPWQPAVDESSAQWRLISHLAINHFGIKDNRSCIKFIKEMLKIYDFGNMEKKNTINCIKSIKHETKMTIFKRQLVPKSVVEICVDADHSNDVFLLARIIAEFFKSNEGFNTKLDVVLKKEGSQVPWKTWSLI